MKRENLGRNCLIAKFNCAECGTKLELSYECRGKVESDYSDGITGAYKVEAGILVEPCPHCVKKPTEDIEKLSAILKEYSK